MKHTKPPHILSIVTVCKFIFASLKNFGPKRTNVSVFLTVNVPSDLSQGSHSVLEFKYVLEIYWNFKCVLECKKKINACEMWIWRKMQRISWTEKKTNE